MKDNIKENIPNEICQFCNKEIVGNDEFYILYKLIISTNLQLHMIKLENIIEDLDRYVMNQGYHLSSTQLLLCRPDIIQTFLNKLLYPEEVIFWFLDELNICMKCFNIYKTNHPEK